MISFKAGVIDFNSGFTGHFEAAFMNLAVPGFSCSLGICYIKVRHLVSSSTFN